MARTIRVFLIVFLLLELRFSEAQNRSTVEEYQIWTGYFNKARFTKRWGSWLDFHVRSNEKFTRGISQLLIRSAITYHLNEQTRISAGFAYSSFFQGRNVLHEHRPWMQLQWNQHHHKIQLMQWIRLEQRNRQKALNDSVVSGSFAQTYRFRFNMMIQYPLVKKTGEAGALFISMNNELMINAGRQVGMNIFDQNRFFAGLGYQLHKNHLIQAGYMNLFMQQPDGVSFRNLHVLRFYYFHSLDFQKANSR